MIKEIFKIVYLSYNILKKINNRILVNPIKKSALKKYGKNVYLGQQIQGNLENISIGNNVSIGAEALFLTANAEIIFGNNIMLGPKVSIVTGNHRIDLLGKYMIDVKDKVLENDQNVEIQDDVWIGMGAIILKGVIIGKGSIIGAGSIVTKSIEPYSIVAGNPAKVIKKRFSEKQIKEHEELLKRY